MTQSHFSQERKLLSISPDGKAKVWTGVTELISKEWVLDAVVGGFGGSTIQVDDVVKEMVRKERRTITDFYRMKEKMNEQKIPEERDAMKNKILARFGTLRTDQLFLHLYAKMQADHRIAVKTRNGQVIKTTLSEQKAYAQERSALAMERKKI